MGVCSASLSARRAVEPRFGQSARRLAFLVVIVASAFVACAPGPGGVVTTEPATVPDPLDSLGEQKPGRGAAVLGIEQLSFIVTGCTTEPPAGDASEARLEFQLSGQGMTSDGKFSVEIASYRSDTGVGTPVISESARVLFGEGDQAKGLEATRSTAGAGGSWLDLTDSTVDEPLLRRRANTVDIRARFGPEGAREGDQGLVEGRLRATCPP